MAVISRQEKDRRIHEIAQLIINGKRTSECARYAAENWGVGRRQAEQYIADARDIIRADFSGERQDFLAEKLAALAKVQEKAMESNQLGAVVGAVRLAAELAQLV